MCAKLFFSMLTLNPPPTCLLFPHLPPSYQRSLSVTELRPISPKALTQTRHLISKHPCLPTEIMSSRTHPNPNVTVSIILRSGNFPNNERSDNLQPVPKNGGKKLVSNCGPLALLSTISKAMKKAINIQIALESHHIINDQ